MANDRRLLSALPEMPRRDEEYCCFVRGVWSVADWMWPHSADRHRDVADQKETVMRDIWKP